MQCFNRLIAVICCVIGIGQTGLAQAEKRVALIIGNATYRHVASLPNVLNDAAAMATLLKAAKFDSVEVRTNLGIAELRRALREFAAHAADAGVAILFFAGHGIEVERVNYLIPVDARLLSDLDVEDETVSVDRALQVMEPARRLRLVILDACRESPFVRSMKRTVATRSVGRGLGRIEPATSNTLIAFATKPNAVAEDGKGPNSPFTAALLKHLATPGLDLRIALGHVRDDVLNSTGNKQEPYVTGSLGGSIVSIAAAVPVPPASQPPPKEDAARLYFDGDALPKPGESDEQRIARLKRIVSMVKPNETEDVLNHWLVGVWEGEVVGLKSKEFGSRRSMTIGAVKKDGSVLGGWAATKHGVVGGGVTIKIAGDQISVTTQYSSIVTLRRSGTGRLEGTFVLKSGKAHRVVLVRK